MYIVAVECLCIYMFQGKGCCSSEYILGGLSIEVKLVVIHCVSLTIRCQM